MLHRASWSLRYSLEGFLKRTLYAHGEPMTEAEIIQVVQQYWVGEDEKNKDGIVGRVHKALSTENGVFEKEGNQISLRDHQPDELNELAYQFLADQIFPQKHGELLRHIQQVTKRSRGELMSRLDLERDWRFARLISGEWTLTEWRIINDEVVDLMHTLHVSRAKRTELQDLVAIESKENTIVFFPELDPRFQVSNDGQVQLLDVKDTGVETEDRLMNSSQDVISSILMELSAYLTRLEERNQQIPQEVIHFFQNDDLKGIEHLMHEKKRNADLTADLQELLKKWNVGVEEIVNV